jgi:cytochrome c oxidase cbb3-type subunit 3
MSHDHEHPTDALPDGTPLFPGPDGIAEADHPMPRWLVLVTWTSILWGIGYVVFMPGLGINLLNYSQYKVYDAEVAEAKAKYASAQGGDIAALVAAAVADPAAAERGKAVYASNCAACHAPDGKGAIGPSLADDTWLYGSKPAEVAHTIASGTAKGMPPFKTSLAPSAVADVTAFIESLKK